MPPACAPDDRLAAARARDDALRDLPALPAPVLRPEAAVTGRRLAEIRRRLAEAEARERAPWDGLAAAEAEMAEVLASTAGAALPAARGRAASLLTGHRHATPGEAA